MLNEQNMNIFTQSWRPDSKPDQLRGLVAMVHGYASESSWVPELTAVAVAKANFFVCALDIQGHGYSDGYAGHIPDIKPVVRDCMQFFDSARADHPKIPAFLEEWKRKLVEKSPNFLKYGKPSAATALEFLRVCEYIKKNCHKLEDPMLMVHGGNDTVCDPKSAMFVYKSAATEDKTLKIYDGMWHQLIGEPNERVELVFGNIISWIGERAEKEKANCNTMSIEK
ncbi:hypothetical protein RJ639_019767 [Escallonia herrerae]|uniref:Serine aminopeptidase S33 domain-containing protein n=1 Tax=Escallonia herrerae TaxID=1293975 RepID=A0AA88VAR5_9ASTE|nr:hypothetical protein RJ639_019767 [Escallonia herrerae]